MTIVLMGVSDCLKLYQRRKGKVLKKLATTDPSLVIPVTQYVVKMSHHSNLAYTADTLLLIINNLTYYI